MLPIVRQNGIDEVKLLSSLRSRSAEVDKRVTEVVSEIIENVKNQGDQAVKDYTLNLMVNFLLLLK